MKKTIALLTVSSMLSGLLIFTPLQVTYGEETSSITQVTLGSLLTNAKESSVELDDLVDTAENVALNIQAYNKSKGYMGRNSGTYLEYSKSGPYYNYIVPLEITPMDLDSAMMDVENGINKMSYGIDIQEKQKMLAYQNAEELLKLSKDTTDLAARKYEIITLLYEKGMASKNDFEKAELEKKIALDNYYNTQYDFKIAKLAIAKTMHFDSDQAFTLERLPVYTYELKKVNLQESLNDFYTNNNALNILRKQREYMDKKIKIAEEYKDLMYDSDYQTIQYNSLKNKKDYATAVMTGKVNISTTVTNINNAISQLGSIERQVSLYESELVRNDIQSTHKYGHDYYENEVHQNLNKLAFQKIQLQTGLFMYLENLAYYTNY